jgi:hypothetical protein
MAVSAPQTSLEKIWDSLPREQRQDAGRELYWIIIGPAIARLFAKETQPEACISTITGLETMFQQSKHELVDPDYWSHMFRQLRVAFSPLATHETILGQIQTLPEDEAHLRLLFYLALSRTPNATLSEICGAHAAVFEFLVRAANPDGIDVKRLHQFAQGSIEPGVTPTQLRK